LDEIKEVDSCERPKQFRRRFDLLAQPLDTLDYGLKFGGCFSLEAAKLNA
jgi:hypothetical protein